MIDSVLGSLHFSTGWKAESEVNLFGKTHRIVKSASYNSHLHMKKAMLRLLSDVRYRGICNQRKHFSAQG